MHSSIEDLVRGTLLLLSVPHNSSHTDAPDHTTLHVTMPHITSFTMTTHPILPYPILSYTVTREEMHAYA